MTVNASIKFTGSITGAGPDGEALVGQTGEVVTVSNVDNTNVAKWQFELLYVPPGSAITRGVKQAYSSTMTWAFTPDTTECFLVRLRVKDAAGNESVDDRIFAIPQTSSGRIIPPFKSSSKTMNIGGQEDGWHPYFRAYLIAVDALTAGDASEGIIFRPGGVTAGRVYATFAEVKTAIAGATSPLTVFGDGSLTGNVVTIPTASGQTDCRGLVTLSQVPGTSQEWVVEDGAQLLNPAGIEGPPGYLPAMILAFSGDDPTPPLAFTGDRRLSLRNVDMVTLSTPNPAIKVAAAATLTLSAIRSTVGAKHIELLAGATLEGLFAECNGIGVDDDAVTSAGAATLHFNYDMTLNVLPTFPNFAGTALYLPLDTMAAYIASGNGAAITTTVTAKGGQLLPVDTTGGAFDVNLPDITTVRPGTPITVKCRALSANAVTVQRFGADTIDGGASFVLTPSIKLVWATFIADVAAANWDVLSSSI